ncbi:hypothetical protein OIU78_007118 [Salix suchowensis]|nr:hypothetical protein OIU78_007118 [Salix suchowensis]
MALVLTLPWKKELGVPTLVEWDQQMGALVSIWNRDPCLHHFFLCCYHWF